LCHNSWLRLIGKIYPGGVSAWNYCCRGPPRSRSRLMRTPANFQSYGRTHTQGRRALQHQTRKKQHNTVRDSRAVFCPHIFRFALSGSIFVLCHLGTHDGITIDWGALRIASNKFSQYADIPSKLISNKNIILHCQQIFVCFANKTNKTRLVNSKQKQNKRRANFFTSPGVSIKLLGDWLYWTLLRYKYIYFKKNKLTITSYFSLPHLVLVTSNFYCSQSVFLIFQILALWQKSDFISAFKFEMTHFNFVKTFLHHLKIY